MRVRDKEWMNVWDREREYEREIQRQRHAVIKPIPWQWSFLFYVPRQIIQKRDNKTNTNITRKHSFCQHINIAQNKQRKQLLFEHEKQLHHLSHCIAITVLLSGHELQKLLKEHGRIFGLSYSSSNLDLRVLRPSALLFWPSTPIFWPWTQL